MSPFSVYFYVMLGGAVGSAARMALSEIISLRFGDDYPYGTFWANILGCLAIGVFMGLTSAEGAFSVSPLVKKAIVIGVFGGFTTFSSFSFQTVTLLQEGSHFLAGANIVLTVVLCLLATWAGLRLAQFVNP